MSYRAYAEWKAWSLESFGACSKDAALYYEAELERSSLDSRRDLDVLEIGFGNGAFAGWARGKGFRYVGSELIPALVARATSAGIRAYADLDRLFEQIGPESVDWVVAFDVFEHLDLDDLESLLVRVREAMRPGARILARVPSGDSPFGRAAYHGDLTHRLALGSSAVHQLALQHDLHVLDIGPPRLPLRGVGARRALRRALVLGAQKAVERVVRVVFNNNQPLVITGNMVFVLGKAG